jgi:hypothetical protein
MTHRLINIALFIGILATYAYVMQEDHSAEMAASAALLDAQKAAQREFKRDMAAAGACRQLYGESGFTWTQEGELVCIPSKPMRLARAQ